MNDVTMDNDGVPLLDDKVFLNEEYSSTDRDNHDNRSIPTLSNALRDDASIAINLDELARDIQAEISWKMEGMLEDVVKRVLHEVIEQSKPEIIERVKNQLKTALPQLIAAANKDGPDPG